MRKAVVFGLLAAVALTGCSTKNRYEKEADKITNAVISNNMNDVQNDFDSQARAQITRVAVARLSDELNAQGKFQGVTEAQPSGAAPNTHFFDAKFEKRMYQEKLVLDDDGKVREWRIHQKEAGATP
ncbi:MAG: hypothetical protein NVS1B14_06260 [Vulcanimicrobiaceae bacterium]